MSDSVSHQQFAPDRIKCDVRLNFHLAYNSRHFNADYGQRYHCDPIYRIETDIKVARGLYQEFGEYGMGDPDPKPALGVGIQPLDFMNAAMGGKILYYCDSAVHTPDRPLERIQTIEDVKRLENINWSEHGMFKDMFEQVAIMQQAHPDLPIDHVQGVWRDGENNDKCFLVMHTPLTTAFRLVGERIMEMMLLETALAEAVFEYILWQYRTLWDTIFQRLNWKAAKIHFGDCAATMLSPVMYDNGCFKMYQSLMNDFDGAVIHSCGPSSHLLESFAQLRRIKQLQLGYGTDLKRARDLFSKSSICAYYGCAELMAQRPQEIEANLWSMSEQLQDNFLLSCDSADPDTPRDNLYMFLNTARKINESCNK